MKEHSGTGAIRGEGAAGGIDAALRRFADTPAGPWLLVVVARGLLLFAAYCFGESRWRRT
ncbi:DUF1206 domain-containing protein [Nonomuraea sp. 3N208]|uniref:DUF1206 domain-containing protein n=1 Tax=Nonomuraea sp. 3N208 TaxID=3457421 RepID=UPI003FD514BA